MDRSNSYDEASSNRVEGKSKKLKEEFKCGEPRCHKLYHSYTAFYNHCKKAHNGEFPTNSLLNGQTFEGPTKNRGRPRMKKNQVKNQYQIESMKAENQLIEFLGTIRIGTSKSGEEVISFVEKPQERLVQAISLVKEWIKDDSSSLEYLDELQKVNNIICDNDLPEFYDPIQYEKFLDRVDSYNFTSIYKFFRKIDLPNVKNEQLLICWLTRILSLQLLTETIFILTQIFNKTDKIQERDFYQGKSSKAKTLIDTYIKYIELEYEQENQN